MVLQRGDYVVFLPSFLGFEQNTSGNAKLNQERSLRELAGLKTAATLMRLCCRAGWRSCRGGKASGLRGLRPELQVWLAAFAGQAEACRYGTLAGRAEARPLQLAGLKTAATLIRLLCREG